MIPVERLTAELAPLPQRCEGVGQALRKSFPTDIDTDDFTELLAQLVGPVQPSPVAKEFRPLP